jgi:hypothetical protein
MRVDEQMEPERSIGDAMRVSCVMPTYGRYGMVCRSLACFLAQTAIGAAELVIYNQHDVPLHFDHPRVRIVNAPPPPDAGMHEIVQRAFELAADGADYVLKWDDDDIYLPWFLELGLAQIGTASAWKPREVMMWDDSGKVSLARNWMEATWLIDRRAIADYPVHGNIRHSGHPVYIGLKQDGKLIEDDVGGPIPFVYMWERTTTHASETGAFLSQEEQQRSIHRFRQRNQDIRPDGLLKPVDLTPIFRRLVGDIGAHLGDATGATFRDRLADWL